MIRQDPIQAGFANALLAPERPLPPGLIAWNDSDPALRFGVYRNNAAVSLTEALAGGFPVTRALVGDAFFEAMARCFVAEHLPRSPIRNGCPAPRSCCIPRAPCSHPSTPSSRFGRRIRARAGSRT